jgi:hypothetical protein
MGEKSGVYRYLVREPEGKTPLGRPRCRWKDNIRMDLQEVGFGGINWIKLAQVRGKVASTCEFGNEPSGSMIFGKLLD